MKLALAPCLPNTKKSFHSLAAEIFAMEPLILERFFLWLKIRIANANKYCVLRVIHYIVWFMWNNFLWVECKRFQRKSSAFLGLQTFVVFVSSFKKDISNKWSGVWAFQWSFDDENTFYDTTEQILSNLLALLTCLILYHLKHMFNNR